MKGESGREYVAILDAYRRGDDAALDRLRALWKQGEAVHQEIWQALDRELAPLALVMHCDLAVRAVATSDDETANWHLAVAGRLASLDRFRQPDASVQARLTRRGYYVLSVWLATGRLRLMPVRLRDAFEAFPNDPDLLLARGSYEETFLNPAIPRPDAPPPTVQVYEPSAFEAAADNEGANAMSGRVSQIRELETTARWFERSLARGPASPASVLEARLRLARLRMAAQRWGDARKALEEVHAQLARLDAPQRLRVRRLEYLALLFSGRTTGQRGDWPAAARSYQQASVLCPVAQTARIGQSHARLMAGDEPAARDEALTLLREADRGVPRRTREGVADDTCGEDPWSEYDFGQRWRVDELLAEMKAAVRS